MFQEAQPSRRLPVYILVDRSGSMDGEAMIAVNQGLQLLKSDLDNEPRAVQTVWVSVISFGDQFRVDVPLTELSFFYPPTFTAGGSTPLGGALQLLNDAIDRDVTGPSSGQSHTGDYKPLVFIFTDGDPTDEWRGPARALKSRTVAKTANIIAVGCGPNVNTANLKEITESVLFMEHVTAGNFQALLAWMSMSIKTASVKLSSGGGAPSGTAVSLPTAPPGFVTVF